ncbi:MAG: ABC transporter substrate-binding protein [Rhizobiaceae bacterium]|nr:ABC transporter substrate-binding protein [Rhizobiaceae bacterium]
MPLNQGFSLKTRPCAALMMLMLAAACLLFVVPDRAHAAPSHALAMHGKPALPPDFKHLPYVNPDAPKGGKITYGVQGTFDSLNPFILKSMRTTARGMWDRAFGKLVFESLLFRSRDEPFTMYGMLAEKVEVPEDRSWVEFTLNPKAKWSDGAPVSVEDIIFTYELLEKKGRPPYSTRTQKIDRIEKTGERRVKFHLNDKSDREFPLIIGLTPVLPLHATSIDTFDQSSLKIPIGSGPYHVSKVNPGQRIRFQRNQDYWAKDLPIKRGLDNYDEITIEYFRSASSLFEAFKKGIVKVLPEGDPAHWRRAFNFPAVEDGRVVKDVFKTGRPAAMFAFFFNTRKKMFSDLNVRRALAMLFDFEWTNKNLFFNAYKRTGSFWHGSSLSSLGIAADDIEKALLANYSDKVLPKVMAGTYLPSKTNGSGRDRKVLRSAFRILKKAGYKTVDGKLVDPNGRPFTFEILCKSQGEEKLAINFSRSLAKIGIEASIRTVDDTQYQRRTQTYEYDMILTTLSASLSPGAEQKWRWDSEIRDIPGSFNYSGAAEPAIDALIDAIVKAKTEEDFTSSVRALDRLLISGHYLIPLFHIDEQWVARWDTIGRPEKTSLYGYQFSTWWDKRAAK